MLDEGFATRVRLSGKWWWSGWIRCIIWKQYTAILQSATVAGNRSNPFFLGISGFLANVYTSFVNWCRNSCSWNENIHCKLWTWQKAITKSCVFAWVLCFLLRWSVNYGITWVQGKVPFEMGAECERNYHSCKWWQHLVMKTGIQSWETEWSVMHIELFVYELFS